MEDNKVTAENSESAVLPEGVKMNVKYSRVLLEFLVCGTKADGKRIKKMTDKMQEQMDKFKGGKKSRILYNVDEDKTEEERKQWLIDNANAKYYVFTPANFSISNTYVRDTLLAIKKFELYFDMLKQKGIMIGKKPVVAPAPTEESYLQIVKTEEDASNE